MVNSLSCSKQARAPALNKFMHPRNPYRTPPSFKQLAQLYPEFRKYCSYDLDGKVRLNFTDPRALAELAIALLHKDFGLTVSHQACIGSYGSIIYLLQIYLISYGGIVPK